MNGKDNDRDGLEALAGLPREMAPRSDPWPEIAARISATEPRRQVPRRLFAWWPQAAAAVLLAAVGILAIQQSSRDSVDPAAESRGTLVRVPAYADTLQITEREYRAALRELRLTTRGSSNPQVPAEENIGQGWVVMLQAEKALEAALHDHPDDPYINERMVQLRTRQVNLLRQISAAGKTFRRHTI